MTESPKRNEIPRQDWPTFCRRFSARHQGWLTSVAVIDTGEIEPGALESDKATRLPVGEMAFREMRVEGKGEQEKIVLVLGDRDIPLLQRAKNPACVLFEDDEVGARKGLRIDDAEGATTLLRFRAAEPEEIDDVGQQERRSKLET